MEFNDFDSHANIYDYNYNDFSYIDTTTLGGRYKTWITTYSPEIHAISQVEWDKARKELEKGEMKVNIIKKQSCQKGEYAMVCSDEHDLSIERVLKTLSAIKGRLMIDMTFSNIRSIECKMTPSVRKNIVTASKKLKMYGKKIPVIARFDEYGNRLSDEITIGDSDGITLKIVDPEEYGEFYLELKGLEWLKTYSPNHIVGEYAIRTDEGYAIRDATFWEAPF